MTIRQDKTAAGYFTVEVLESGEEIVIRLNGKILACFSLEWTEGTDREKTALKLYLSTLSQ